MNKHFVHVPVLLEEVLKIFHLQKGQKVADLTLGLGGHSEKFCLAVGKEGLCVGIDRDAAAVEKAQERLSAYSQFHSYHTNFVDYFKKSRPKQKSLLGFDAILADLGVSSLQFDDPERGFSFRSDAPLDMRMDNSETATAADIINNSSPATLRNIFQKYGEISQAKYLAEEIVRQRPLHTTLELADLSATLLSRHRPKIHPATQVFQALRIAVNDELRAVEEMLPLAFQALNPGGKLAIISFHSLEDRLVKDYFRKLTQPCSCPPESPICTCSGPQARNLGQKPITPSAEEIKNNPRSRSAKLRIIQKI